MEPDYIPAAEFLPKLPKSNLDDRSFEDLVEECLLRIPRYCPEWTNYNPGDPGVTLIELFAWLVHQMLYRFNQVPRRHYVAFLELLGIRLLPPQPAIAELTFYLTKEHSEPKLIYAGTEVATERTENQEAIIFTTRHDLIIGRPQIKHLLIADQALPIPSNGPLDNRFTSYEAEQRWDNLEIGFQLFQPCQPGSCFYLVLEPAQIAALQGNGANGDRPLQNHIEGNVLAFRFKGPRAVTTGIMPDNPPLDWQVWTGDRWKSGILRQRSDDHTKGFSFDRLGDAAPNPEQEGADVVLHLPQHWPVAQFGNYNGHWIRCVYSELDVNGQQTGYERSPEITGIRVRAIGGTITASECIQLGEEFLGTSDGKAGQQFELEGTPILARSPEEHIRVRLPDGTVEDWQEVDHFGDSGQNDPHYLIDSKYGVVQFGPLIREPSQIQIQTRDRSQLQSWGRPMRRRQELGSGQPHLPLPAVLEAEDYELDRQYGRVLPLGAEIYMTRYRVGGGSRGNVKREQLKVLKTAIPYIKRVVNYEEATGGADAESLDQAIMRVPALLRTRKTALTPEEFERTARQFTGSQITGSQTNARLIHRAHCVTTPDFATPGVVHLLVIPHPPSPTTVSLATGIHPQNLILTPELTRELQAHLDTHKALGIRVKPDSPDYVGVKVVAEVMLNVRPQSRNEAAAIRQSLCTRLYRFFNPITGGLEGNGWPLGRAVRASDAIAQLQADPIVQYVGTVELHSLRRNLRGGSAEWVRVSGPDVTIPLGPLDVVCSWSDVRDTSSSHEITFLDP